MTRLLKLAATIAVSAAFVSAQALADVKSEKFVEENANEVLAALNSPNLDSATRTDAFNAYMDEFANMNAVARVSLGKYARRFSKDDFEVYRQAFREYALAVYEVQLDQYRGEAVTVLGSDDNNDRDSIVKTRITKADGESLDVYWRVFLRPTGYEVVDVALSLDGNVLWLGSQQRRQFVDLLDQNRGEAKVLVSWLHEATAKLRAEQAAGRNVSLEYDAKDDISGNG